MKGAPAVPAGLPDAGAVAAQAGAGGVAAQAGGDTVEVTFHTGLAVLVLALATVVLGLYIAYQAYRGYRRNQSRPMLYLSVGIVLLTFVPAVFSTLGANVEALAGGTVLVSFLSRVVGLLSILYAIKYA